MFDGRGGLWRAEVVHAGRKSAAVRPLEPLAPARELRVPVTLVMSVLKGDKMDDVVRDAVMLTEQWGRCAGPPVEVAVLVRVAALPYTVAVLLHKEGANR